MRVTTSKGKVWERVRFEPYTRKDGTQTELAVWVSECETCGEPFEVKTPAKVERAEQSTNFEYANCYEHRLSQDEIKKRWLNGIRQARGKPRRAPLGKIERALLDVVDELSILGDVTSTQAIYVCALRLRMRRKDSISRAMRSLHRRNSIGIDDVGRIHKIHKRP